MRSSSDSSSILRAIKDSDKPKSKKANDSDFDWLQVGKSMDKRKAKSDIDKWCPLDFGKMVSNWVYEKHRMWIGCGPAKYAEFMKKINRMLKDGTAADP